LAGIMVLDKVAALQLQCLLWLCDDQVSPWKSFALFCLDLDLSLFADWRSLLGGNKSSTSRGLPWFYECLIGVYHRFSGFIADGPLCLAKLWCSFCSGTPAITFCGKPYYSILMTGDNIRTVGNLLDSVDWKPLSTLVESLGIGSSLKVSIGTCLSFGSQFLHRGFLCTMSNLSP
jgi:hypothetical protein